MHPGTSLELERQLADLLVSVGSDYSVDAIRDEIGNTLHEIRADSAARGSATAPFYGFSAWRGAAVFTFFADGLEIYVVPFEPKEEWSLIEKFERLAMIDCDEAREVLRRDYGKSTPDIHVDAALASDWLRQSSNDTSSGDTSHAD